MKAFFTVFLFYSLYSFADTKDCLQSVSSAMYDHWPNTEHTSAPPRFVRVKEIILHHLEKKRIIYTNHAIQRMEERSISDDDVRQTLREGIHLSEEDSFNYKNNDWLYFITDNIEDSSQSKRPLRIAVSLWNIRTNTPRIVVISAMIKTTPPPPQENPTHIRNIGGQHQHSVSSTTHYWPNTENTSAPPRVLPVKEITLHHLEKGHIAYTRHASDQMKEQLISKDDVEQTLREGVHFSKDDIFNNRYNDWHYYISDIKRASLATKPLKVTLSLQYIHTNEPRIVVISAIVNLPPKNLRKAPKSRMEQRQRRKKNLRKKITNYEDYYDEDFDADDY